MILRNCYSNSKNSTKKDNQNSSGRTWRGKLFLSQKHGMHTELCSAWKRFKEQKAYFFAGDAIFHWYWHRLGQLQVLHPLSQPTPFIYIVYINVTYISYVHITCTLDVIYLLGCPSHTRKPVPCQEVKIFPRNSPNSILPPEQK